MNEAAAFLRARDFLLQHREDYAAAKRGFEWPQLTHFNWALDYFDVMAQGNDSNALWIVGQDGCRAQEFRFGQMAERSSRVANHLRALACGGATCCC
jgi:acetyl-CoA synthetase